MSRFNPKVRASAPTTFGWRIGKSGEPPQKRFQLGKANLTSVLNQLEQERTRLASQLERLNQGISTLNGAKSSGTRKGTMSAAGRARIAAAQRARWAKVKGRKVVSITARKRTMSPSARRKIAAAQRARWAKWKKQQKSA